MAGIIMSTLIQLLTLAVAVHECAARLERDRCVTHPPCLDLLVVERITYNISKELPGTDHDNILLKSQTFDKIRKKKYLHSCVLGKIIDFFEIVFAYTCQNSSGPYTANYNELISVMDSVRRCTFNVKRCINLYQKSSRQPISEISEADMTPEEVAIFQLQKLTFARQRINDTSIQERAMDEVKSLHYYIPGSGFRKSNS